MSDEERVRLRATVSGNVQGVGFRAWVRKHARPAGLVGSATNLDDGCVEVVAEGSSADCQQLLDRLRGTGTPGSVTGVRESWVAAENDLDDFVLG